MPPGPPAVKAVTVTGDQAGATETPAPAHVTAGRGPRKVQLLPPRRAARAAQTALPALACQEGTGTTRPEARRDRLRRVSGLLRRVLKTAGSYHDPLFERPDLVENDYYRFRNYPDG